MLSNPLFPVNKKISISLYLFFNAKLISTPAGSSAYNLSLRGPVIPVGAKVLALTPISPYRPRRWRGALLDNDAKITLHALDSDLRPVRAEADFMQFEKINKLEIVANFSGSAGFILILKNSNHLFVDGRYTIQAKQQSGKKFKIITIPTKLPKDVLKTNKKIW